jgi:hypothetical protein
MQGDSNPIEIHLNQERPKDTILRFAIKNYDKLTVLGVCIGEKADAAVARAATRRI